MKITVGGLTYSWVDSWAQIPVSESSRLGWAHHGVVVAHNGEVITFHPGDPTVLGFNAGGALVRSWDAPVVEAHGMALATDGSTEFLWIADPGAKRDPAIGYQYQPGPRAGQVIKFHLSGKVAMKLARPALLVYGSGTYSPTSVTVFPQRHGRAGDVWVADGYGESYVHRYSGSGDYLGSINGEEGRAGRFNCPHAVFADTRKTDPELYIADRTNRRVQVFDTDGRFKRSFGADFLTSPSAFAVSGGYLFIAELRGRLAVLDREDRLVGYLGADPVIADVERGSPTDPPAWPNRQGPDGGLVRPGGLKPGKFNSPHGVAADGHGNLFVVEWLIGGRYTKLVKS